MDYGNILARSWRITWKNKFLWILGFLAALTRAGGNTSSNFQNSASTDTFSTTEIVQFSAMLAMLACIGLIIGLILWLLSLVAKGGLITAVARLDNDEEVSFKSAFSDGTAKIGSLVGMNLLLYLPLIVLMIFVFGAFGFAIAGAIGGSVTAGPDMAGAMEEVLAAGVGLVVVLICFLICIIAVLGVIISFLNAFAYRGIMLRDMGATQSISHAWSVIRENLAEVLVLCIIFFFIGAIFAFGVFIILLPASLVLIVPALGLSAGGQIGFLSGVWLIGGAILLGVLGAALYAVLTTWQSATFTLAYQEWTSKAGDVKEFDDGL